MAEPRHRVLVTGVRGFVGGRITQHLIDAGHPVCPVVFDLTMAESVRDVFRAFEPDWVFHCAAHGGYSWQTDALRIVASNVTGTLNVLDAVREFGVKAFVNAGSSVEYGALDHAPNEDEPLAPRGPYAVSKAAATTLLAEIAKAENLPVATLRLYSVYGPGEHPDRFIPQLIEHGRRGVLPTLTGDPQAAHDFVHVDDVVDAFSLVARYLEEPKAYRGLILNCGSGWQKTNSEVVELARRHFGISEEAKYPITAPRPYDTTVWRSDPTRLRSLGWGPRTLADGFAHAADHW